MSAKRKAMAPYADFWIPSVLASAPPGPSTTFARVPISESYGKISGRAYSGKIVRYSIFHFCETTKTAQGLKKGPFYQKVDLYR
jgi:hypothetical protein